MAGHKGLKHGACFRHRLFNKKGNCDLLFHNNDFLSQNSVI